MPRRGLLEVGDGREAVSFLMNFSSIILSPARLVWLGVIWCLLYGESYAWCASKFHKVFASRITKSQNDVLPTGKRITINF